jgi:peptide/nickel transport system substrate-binding protein
MSAQPHHDKEIPLTRRQALQHIALLTAGSGIALDLLAACADSSTKPGTQPSLAPTPRNQTVIIDSSHMTVFDSFNPFIPNGESPTAGLFQAGEEFLFYYNMVTGEMKPWLAKSWEYNADDTQMTLHLDPTAHWNDGTPFTASDVQFTIQLLLDNTALSGAGAYTPFVKSMTTPDAQTIVFTLKSKNSRFHYNFVCGIQAGQIIMPKHIWSKQDPMKFKEYPPVRTGPYKLDRTIPAQNMYIWKKDPNYWNKSNLDPEPEYLVFRYSPTLDSEVEEFKRAQVDVPFWTREDYAHAIAIKNSGYKNMIIESKFRDPCPRAFAINCDPSKGLLADPRMHWILSYLVDRKTLGATVWPVPTPPAQYPWADYPANDKWSNQEIAAKYPLTYDPQKAATLLDELGAKLGSGGKRLYQGQPLQYEIMTSDPVGGPEYTSSQSLADEMNKIGIGATVRYYDGAVWTDKFNNGQFDISAYYICGLVLDPGQLYSGFEIRNGAPIGKDASAGGNYQRTSYKDLDTLAVELDSSDPSKLATKGAFDQALEAYYKDLPLIPTYQTTYLAVFNTTYWTGWPSDDNLYQVPLYWWGQFLFIIGSLKPTGQS